MAELWPRVAAEGRAAHPDVDLPDERLAARLSALDAGEGPLAWPDLYLACACAEGVASALARFEQSFIARLDQALARVERDPQVIDEVRQRVRVRLLVGSDDAPPRIATYRGKGALAVWVRVTALREHQNLRGQSPAAGDPSDELPDLALLSPELAATHAQHRAAAEASLREALKALPRRERLLLKMAYVDGMSTEAIGRVFGVNKSTVSRWLTAIRDTLLTEVVSRIAGSTGATSAEIKSLLRLISGDLDVSLATLLRSA